MAEQQIWRGWKTLAILFIILFTLETVIVIGLYKIGAAVINNETKCANEICMNGDYDSYTYQDNTCICYKDDEVAYTKYMG